MNAKKTLFFAILFGLTNLVVMHISFAESKAVNQSAKTKNRYDDISGHWAEEKIRALIDKGILKGKSKGNNKIVINPDGFITRAELAAVFVQNEKLALKSDKSKRFNDVKLNEWYKKTIDIAFSNGIIGGYPDNTFKPNDYATRAEVAVLVSKMKAFSEVSITSQKQPYKDVSSKDWFNKSVILCKNRNIINGYSSGLFMPKKKATRAETFTIIYNAKEAIERIIKEKADKELAAKEQAEKKKLAKELAAKEKAAKEEAAKELAIKEQAAKDRALQEAAVYAALKKNTTDTKLTAMGATEDRPVLNLNPTITLEGSFSNNNNYIETRETSFTILGSVFGNTPKKISYTVQKDNGTGKKTSVVEATSPVISSVVRDVYTQTLKFQISLQPIMEDLNIISLTVTDVYDNSTSKTVQIMKFVDNDNDGLSNFDERQMGTNINVADTDADGLSDYQEAKNYTDPLKKDTDFDELSDYDEVVKLNWKTSPMKGYSVSKEVSDKNLDLDGDELTNFEELYIYHSDPLGPDTDKDGLPDGVEISEYATDPTKLDTNNNGIDDFSEVINGTIKNQKVFKAKGEDLDYDLDIYSIPANENIDKVQVKMNDNRASIVLRIQYLLNRILISEKKIDKLIRYTGEFNEYTRNALFTVFSVDEINMIAFNELVKRVKALPEITDTYIAQRSYIEYSLTESLLGVKEFKVKLEKWRLKNAPINKALYTVTSLYEKDGTMNGLLDESSTALLKLFQENNGLKGTGKINDKTAEILLSPSSLWKVNSSQIRPEAYLKESFGKDMFYRYVGSKKHPLNPVYYSQLYGPWSNEPYYAIKRGASQSDRVVAVNGCGPTSTAMLVATLADRKVDPAIMARFSMEMDAITKDYDTEGKLYGIAAKAYGLKYEYSSDVEYVKRKLKDGLHLAIASMGEGHYTRQGHLIALMGVIQLPGEDFERIIVYDSNTGNKSYGNDGAVVLSNEPGIVYGMSSVIARENKLGFFIMSK